MKQYINKSAVVAEIESKRKYAQHLGDNAINSSMQQFYDGMKQGCVDILSFLDTLEVKEVETWHLQEKEDIYDAVKDWELHTFACIMKDGTIQKFTGIRDEDYEDHINVHIDGTSDDYDDVDDIVKWAYLDDLLNTNSFNVEVKEVDLEEEIHRYYVDWDEHPQYVQTARHFAKWQKERMVDKACDWLADNYSKYIITNGLSTIFSATIDFDTIRMIEDFKKAMDK